MLNKKLLSLWAISLGSISPSFASHAIEDFGNGVTFDTCLNTYTASIPCTTDCGEAGTKTGTGGSVDTARGAANAARCVASTVPSSVIDVYTFNHVHTVSDYLAPGGTSTASCTSCTGDVAGPANIDPSVGLERIHRSRDTFQPSSLGIGVFLSYDISLTLFETNGLTYIDCFNSSWSAARRYAPSGQNFIDNIYNSCRAFVLYDAAGAPTTVRANAVRGTLVNKDGSSVDFELFAVDANQTSGRPTVFRALDGRPLVTIAYAYAATDIATTPEQKRCLATVTDSRGDSLAFTYATLATGRLAVSSVAIPGGRTVGYSYDAQGNLISVTLPNGDASSFTRSVSNNIFSEVFSDVSADGYESRKTAYYSNNMASYLLSLSDRPQLFNQSSMLIYAAQNGADEIKYFATNQNTNGSIHRKIYTGGGRLRFFDVANSTHYKTWTKTDPVLTRNKFNTLSGTLETYGHVAPFANYAANRSGTSPVVTTPEGLVHNFTYDANGNMTTQRIGAKKCWSVSDARFNKPIMEVDFDGKAKLCSYDAAGNLISEKNGWVMDRSLGAGVELPGLAFATYPSAGSFAAIDTATPDMIVGVDSISPSGAANTASRFSGKLVLATAGVRTFHMKVNKGQSRLHINGGYYTRNASQGETSISINLSAGVHDIKWETIGGASDFTLAWSGPETVVGGTPVKSAIASTYLRHVTTADEYAVHAGPEASEKTWEYYPTGNALAGLLKASVDATGKRTEYSYNANRRLTEVKETGDAGTLVTVKTLTYDSVGRVATQSDALGRTVTFAYDARDRKVKTTYGDNTTETVKYGTGVNANLIVESKDRAGSVTKTDYDAAGRAATVTRGYALADNDGAITATLANPSVETTTYLDGTTDVATRTVDGKITEYAYDYKGRLVASTSRPSTGKTLVSSTNYSLDELRFCETDPHGCRSFYAYRDLDKQLVREIRELVPGALTAVNAAFGNVTTLAASATGNATLLAVARDTAPNPGYAVTDHTLDNQGRTILTTDARGVQTATAYDAKGRVASRTLAVGTPQQQVMTVTYDAADRVIAQTDALSRTTQKEYFPSGRAKKVIFPDTKTQEFTYYADGRLASRKDEDGFVSNLTWSQCCGREFGSANALGEGTLKFYDGPGRVTYQVVVKDVAAASGFVNWTTGISLPSAAVVSAQTMKYDARGRLIASTKWNTVPASVDPHNVPIAPANSSDGFTTTYEYFDNLSDTRFADALSQLAAKGVTLTTGSASLVTNPAGEQSFNITDAAGRSVASGVFNK